MTAGVIAWLDRHARHLLWWIGATAVVSRALLSVYSPRAFGYIYDPYWETVEKLYGTWHFPDSAACWECYQPPLYPLVSLPFYAVGQLFAAPRSPQDSALRFMQVVPLASSLLSLWYTYRLLKLFRYRGAYLVTGCAIAVALPVLFLSSYSLEPDMLLGTIVAAFAYYATRWHLRPSASRPGAVTWLGVLAGLAAATKYSGLVALVVGVVLIGANVVAGPARRHAVRDLAAFLLVAAAIGSSTYVSNVRNFGTPFYANGSAADGFRLVSAASHRNLYEFGTLRLRDLLVLTRPDARPGQLTDLPVYRSFWTTLHGLTWGDMGFFTNPTRHGAGRLYQDRHIPPWLSASVLLLGFVPTALAAIGVATTVTRRAFRPLALLCVVGLASYLHWVVRQPSWAIKAKYLLFLLPAYVLYTVVGTRWAVCALPGWISAAVVALMLELVVLSVLYQLYFAVGK